MTFGAECGQVANQLVSKTLVGAMMHLQFDLIATEVAGSAPKAGESQLTLASEARSPSGAIDVRGIVHKALLFCPLRYQKNAQCQHICPFRGRMCILTLMKQLSEAREEIPTPRMVRAARALVGIDQSVLAEEVGVDRKTIVRIETDTRQKIDARRRDVLMLIKEYFQNVRNIEFIFPSEETGEGVRLRSAEGFEVANQAPRE
jgi:DNA-binding XRE family transcriptional regulator